MEPSDELKKEIHELLGLMQKHDWKVEKFNQRSAWLCAELSNLVYRTVSQYELKEASRFHLFASKALKISKQRKVILSLETVLKEMDWDNRYFVLRTTYATFFGIRVGDVIHISVRGTVKLKLWDWRTNFSVGKHYVNPAAMQYHDYYTQPHSHFYHKGFYQAYRLQERSLFSKILELNEHNGSTGRASLVWSGHSLGGAIASIGFQSFERHLSFQERFAGDRYRGSGPFPSSIACYSFASPNE